MVDVEPDADALAERVVVVARDQREHLAPALQSQGVEDLCAAERLGGPGSAEKMNFALRDSARSPALGLADQICSSATNFIGLFALARWLTPTEFGVVTVASLL